jgi:hypothetical protein
MLKKVLWGIIFMFSLLLVCINFRLYADNFNKNESKKDILLQLNFLNQELKNNDLGKRMQSIFPEGFVFTNALYGLSWCELGLSDTSVQTKKQALKEALYAYHQINSAEAKSIFNPSLSPQNGIFCVGWNNYLLSKILLLDTDFEQSSAYKTIYVQQCESIVSAFQHSKSPFLESYENQAWPADMCVAMASVSNHDKIFEPKYKTVISDWVLKVKAKTDPITKLIPHEVNAENGETIEGARGCSISLILRLLSEIDSNFASQQYQLYKENFVSTTFGLPSISEYPKSQSGFGDIDSGPVIFGVGFAGTIVSVGTFSVFGDHVLAENQYKTINSFGLSYKTAKTKQFALGLLPVADAFIAWSRSSGLNKTERNTTPSVYWRLKFHFISICFIGFLWTLFYARKLLEHFKK